MTTKQDPDSTEVLAAKLNVPVEAVAFSMPFRRVSNGYPLTVNYAYAGDLARAIADDDATVAET
jgi:hypothetical protein